MTTDANRVTFGVKTSQAGVGYEEILRFWREADALPAFEHAWLWDHLVPMRGDVRGPALEAWTLLAALAAQTTRLRLGVIVTSNRIRPPALLAKMAATVDVVAGGRLDFGIGVGGSLVPDTAVVEGVRREYEAYGVEVVAVRDAVAALGEACTIFKRMWTETDPFDFAGRHYQLTGAICEPKPIQRPGPPILIGAGGERAALRVVAEHADIWNAPVRTTEEFRHKSRVLDDYCATVGRDPAEIVRSKQLLVNAADPSAPEAAQEALLELIDAGARHLVLAPFPPLPPAAWLADEIVEPVLERVAARA
ncbi:MAG TPA: LLM class flavin-dependent oxidoreductase [Solirubrobacteraceae bacterium]|nr:LLM class flavin-dependent oxidoreductase [Solirubrobacteraceae bacterium]